MEAINLYQRYHGYINQPTAELNGWVVFRGGGGVHGSVSFTSNIKSPFEGPELCTSAGVVCWCGGRAERTVEKKQVVCRK